MSTIPQTKTTLELMVSEVTGELAGIFEMMEWAEDEIQQAIRRHPRHRDTLWHSFSLLKAGDLAEKMGTEFVYRSHAAELLERVVCGADTRPATAAELILICSEASKVTPLHAAGAGLYFRLWAKAFPNHQQTAEQATQLVHYEKLFAARMDEDEAVLRRKAANPDRLVGIIECQGMHHGEKVDCKLATRQDDEDPRREAARAARPSKYAAKFAAETVSAEPARYVDPTDGAFAETFANCGRIPPASTYPAIRAAFMSEYKDAIAAARPKAEPEPASVVVFEAVELDLWGPALDEIEAAAAQPVSA